MRLIDADELREHIVYADISTKAVDALIDALDAVPVVRCEDCRHWRRDIISRLTGPGAARSPRTSGVRRYTTPPVRRSVSCGARPASTTVRTATATATGSGLTAGKAPACTVTAPGSHED